MDLIYSVQGVGRLLADGSSEGAAAYEIGVYQNRNLKECQGIIRAEYGLLHKAFTAAKSYLVMENGQKVEVLIFKLMGGAEEAPIHVNDIPERH